MPQIVGGLCLRATVCRQLGRFDEAEGFLGRALAMAQAGRDRICPNHGLALLRLAQGEHRQAEVLFRHALELREVANGPHHPWLADVLEDYAPLLQAMGRDADAAAVEARARAIREAAR